MSLTFSKRSNTPTQKSVRLKATAVSRTSSFALFLFMLTTLLIFAFGSAAAQTTTTTMNDQYLMVEYLNTQAVLTDTLRRYIEALQQKIGFIKSKTNEIKAINDVAAADMHKYVSNPLNALTILKRVTSDWQMLRQYAHNIDSTTEIVKNLTITRKSLKFPSESDFDEAALNLLRIQGVYQLEPERLAVGEVNGIKLGAAMSWSDCLEIGRKSVKNGDFVIAKFWMEVALGKLPAVAGASIAAANATEGMSSTEGLSAEVRNARLQIMEALAIIESNMGNLDSALDIINTLLKKHPKNKNLLKTKARVEKKFKKPKKNSKKASKQSKENKAQSGKSVEELLIGEICRAATNIDAASSSGAFSNSAADCRLIYGNLPELLLQPLQVELLSLDPYIAIYHNVLSAQEISDLQQIIADADDGDEAAVAKLLKHKSTTERLQLATGHAGRKWGAWQMERWTFEEDVHTDALLPATTEIMANVLFNLQTAKLGGAIVFPQLELGITLPTNALLYWTQLNEYHEYDYRSKQHVCPVIVGTQLTAYTSIQA
ncbi:prolyl 4-hydroxylase subunit alpha-2 [Bactrocera dorsalis]|uniref:Prolyl 4-hydroxylase subunit alpha-2 n=1 Tax=Bactrocera dorsalis TaxID=27457 RepID=A0A8N4QFI8_BACDO|nr:prolyl 4-hydroxylase subunit alpha-2 [Bactrocera dorsalis]